MSKMEWMGRSGALLGALAVAFWGIGCGGDGDTTPPGGGASLPLEGRVEAVTGTLQVQGNRYFVNGVEVRVPAGVPLAGGQTMAVLRPGSRLFTATFPPGTQVLVNNQPTGAQVNPTNGSLAQPLAFPPGQFTATLDNAFITGGSRQTSSLEVGVLRCDFTVFPDGSNTLPIGVDGIIPGDGQTTEGAYVTATFSAAAEGRSATLEIQHGGGVLRQTRTISNRSVTFRDLTPVRVVNVSSVRLSVP